MGKTRNSATSGKVVAIEDEDFVIYFESFLLLFVPLVSYLLVTNLHFIFSALVDCETMKKVEYILSLKDWALGSNLKQFTCINHFFIGHV